MKTDCTRRQFIKTAAIGTGLVLIGTLSTKALAGDKTKKNVTFEPVKEGKKGCQRCPKAISDMLKNPKMKEKLIELMPDNSTIYFYARRHPSSTKIPDNSIAVGGCTKPLQNQAMLFVPGCTRQISTQYVFDTIVKQLEKK